MTVITKKQKQLAARRGSAKRVVVAVSGIALGLAIAITVAAQQIGGSNYDQPNNWRPASAVTEDNSLKPGGSFVPGNQNTLVRSGNETTSSFVPSVPSSASIIDPRTQSGQTYNQATGANNPNVGRTGNPQRIANAEYSSIASRTFQLRNLSIDAFETALLNVWGPNLKAQTQNFGRQVRVLLPNRENQHAEMIIDREKGQLQFFGPNSLVGSWRRAMSYLDIAAGNQNGVSKLVNMGRAKPATVNKAVTLLTSHQEEADRNQQFQKALPFTNVNQDGTPRVIYQTDGQQDEDQPQQGNVGLDRPITIEIIEELGLILIRGGNEEDLKKVQEVINQISLAAQATQPEIKIFNLSYANSQSMRDTLQQLYDQIYQTRYGTISISAMSSPNAIMAIGRKDAIEAIGKLIDNLDKVAPDPGAAFKTYRLNFMSAPDAKVRLDEYFGAQQNQAFAPAVGQQSNANQPVAPVLVIADYRSNSILVKASPREIVLVDELIKALDVDGGKDGSGATHVVEVLQLKNAVASELAQVIQDAINGGLINPGQGQNPTFGLQGAFGQQQLQQQQLNQTQSGQGQSQIPARSLSLMMVDQQGKTVRSGLMFDVRVSSDPNSNSIIVTGPEKSMNLIKILVNQLDRLPDAETQLKVFTIVNGQAELMLQALQSMFGGGTQGAQGFAALGNQGTLSQLPLQSGNATEGTTLVNLRFGVDTRTNSIIVSGPIGDLKVIEDLITRLDEKDFRSRRVSVYRLNNLSATDMATAVNDYLDSRRSLNDLDPQLVSPYDQADREIIVIPEAVSNSLIISATPQYYPIIEGIIRALDRRPPMVKVKVTIAEVQLSALKELGFEYGVQDSLLFDRGIGTIGFPFNQQGLGNNSDALSLGTREDFAGQGLLNLSVGRTNSALGYGGLVLSAGNESINVLMRALKDRQALRILSSPHITTVDNLTASVIVGADVPRISGVTNTTFGVTNSVESTQVGIILQVTPRVNPDGSVIMDIDVTNSAVGPEEQGIPIFVTEAGETIRSPQINLQQAQSTILAQSGQTVMFGGLITEEKTEVQRGIPFFSDIPGVGGLFRYRADAKERQELLIIMTPYIVESPDEISLYNQVEMDRMHWCEADVVDLHGDLNSNNDVLQFDHSRPEVVFPDRQPTIDRIERGSELPSPQGSYEREFENEKYGTRSQVIQPASDQRGRSLRSRDSSIPIGTTTPSSFGNASQTQRGSYQVDSQGNRSWDPVGSGSFREQSVFDNQR